ncbi:MAG TPA: 50S ribosomal protein L18 [Aestuariivirgaceae bacterium]|jgi:large subunit ribosomal protein L18
MAKLTQTERRRARVRKQLKRRSAGRLRLSVFRSDKNIYAQIIDDQKGVTLVAASSIDRELRSKPRSNKKAAASEVGKLVAERAKKAGVTDVVFDRGGYQFHGRIKALADGAREGGLNF